MDIGFTGSGRVFTNNQRNQISAWIDELRPESGAHGDCIQADFGFHLLLAGKDILIDIHPPRNPKHRAFAHVHTPDARMIVRQCEEYSVRNRHIVDGTDIMLACPERPEYLRSGTWSAIRYARKQCREIWMVFPTGVVRKEEWGLK